MKNLSQLRPIFGGGLGLFYQNMWLLYVVVMVGSVHTHKNLGTGEEREGISIR